LAEEFVGFAGVLAGFGSEFIAMEGLVYIHPVILNLLLSYLMIQEYENLLRIIISGFLGAGDNVNYKISPERIEKWKEKKEIEKKKHNGLLVEARLIYYSDFYDLGNIISKNWEVFKPIFDDKKRFDVLFQEIESFRNTLSHSRPILPYQEHFLKGIIGDLKTKIVIHHNRNMNADDYFIKVLKVSDNLGNNWDNTMNPLGLTTTNILRVGDSIELLIDAFDPKGREITYEVQWGDTNLSSLSNSFVLSVNKSMIKPRSEIYIRVSTKEDDYENKDSTFWRYSVLP
jgi:hypothetical protein